MTDALTASGIWPLVVEPGGIVRACTDDEKDRIYLRHFGIDPDVDA